VTNLIDLAVRVEDATGPCRNLDNAIRLATNSGCAFADDPLYTASLDAAMMLVPEGCPFYTARDTDQCHASVGDQRLGFLHGGAFAATPALALTAAALRALSR
jgi:hypothetical protein